MEKVCVVRIMSALKKRGDAQSTIKSLRLNKLHSCTIIDKTDANIGMLKKVDNLITYGELDEDSLKALLKRRAMVSKNKRYEWQENALDDFAAAFLSGKKTLKDLNIKEVFSLHPPTKGFERKGKKTPFNLGGAFGYRGDKINLLLKRMI